MVWVREGSKLFSDESLWVGQRPCVHEQKCVDLFELQCFWDEQVGRKGDFPNVKTLSDPFWQECKETHSYGCFTECLCLRSPVNTSIC